MWSGSEASIPAGWALCNGQASNGRTTPDLRGRFVIGSSGSRPVGSVGGAETFTLALSQIPGHVHTASGSVDSGGAHTHGFRAFHADFRHGGSATEGSTKNDGDGTFTDSGAVLSGGSHSHSFSLTTSSAGGGQPVDKMPPFYALAFIMRVQ